MLGTLLTRWTIRLALAAYALWLGGTLLAGAPSGGSTPRVGNVSAGGLRVNWQHWSRWLYTLGCGLFLAHVACAFGFYHHWSHLAAYEDTARQTRELLGFAFGEGVYFNYLFTLLWVADVAWLWISPQHRPFWLTAAIQLYMAFVALNGAVVFEAGVTRWVGIPIALALGALAIRRLVTPHSALRNP